MSEIEIEIHFFARFVYTAVSPDRIGLRSGNPRGAMRPAGAPPR